LASQFGLVPWSGELAIEDARRLFERWVEARGGKGALEEVQYVETLRRYLEEYGDSRFEAPERTANSYGQEPRPVDRRTGYRTGTGDQRRWLISPVMWKELFSGFDSLKAAKFLHKSGFLEKQEFSPHFAKLHRLPDWENPRRFYTVKATILEGDKGEQWEADDDTVVF
jgi:hypothetical protein